MLWRLASWTRTPRPPGRARFCCTLLSCLLCFFKQKTAYDMRISDWSSDVCSSDLNVATASRIRTARTTGLWYLGLAICGLCGFLLIRSQLYAPGDPRQTLAQLGAQAWLAVPGLRSSWVS